MNHHWEHFHHLADIGIRGFGESLAEAFQEIALALTAVVIAPNKIPASAEQQISCANSGDIEILLYDWLNAIIYEMDVHRLVFGSYRVTIHSTSLTARAIGAKFDEIDTASGDVGPEIKAATFTELRVKRLPGGLWLAQCVLDV